MNFVDDTAKNTFALLPPEQQNILEMLVKMLLDPSCRAYVCPPQVFETLHEERRAELFDEHGTPLPGPRDFPLYELWAITDHLNLLTDQDIWLIQLTGDVESLLLDCTMQALGWLKEHSGVNGVFALKRVSRRMQELNECIPEFVKALNGLSEKEEWAEEHLNHCSLEMLVWLKQRAGIESSVALLMISWRLQTIAH